MNSYILVNSVEIYKFKAKGSQISSVPLYVGNVSKDFSADGMKNLGLCGYFYNLLVDYDSTDVDDISDIHKYLIKKHDTKYSSDLLKKVFIDY